MGLFKVINGFGDGNTTRQQTINIENRSNNNKHRKCGYSLLGNKETTLHCTYSAT